MDVLSHPSVTSIVGFGDSPVPVPESEIEAVRAILASGRPAGPWPFLKAGQRVRIGTGALTGVEGVLVREKDAWRVVVQVELLQRGVAVEIDRDMIEPI
jgi:transcription antitermination factor NusG